jgi:cell division protease FtsH
MGMLIWNALTYLRAAPRPTQLPYSAFLEQVRSGNVDRVVIAGAQISGTFRQPISWPGSTPVASPEATPEAATEPISAEPAAAAEPYSAFTTVFPDSLGDPRLLPLLEAHGTQIEAEAPSPPWITIILTDGLPLLLLVLVVAWMGRRGMQAQGGIFSFGRSRPRKVALHQTGVTFQDVAGAEEAKRDLAEVVDFLRHPQKYHDLGARIPRGVLLVGPPGSGKTLLARAVAGEAEAPFFNLSASEFVEMFVGVGASRVRDLFEQAKQAAPAIVFIDELDAVGRRRGAGLGAVNDEREQTLNQLLVEMDGFDERQEVILLAATNRPDVLDPALLRPGRFDRQVVVGTPDRRGRLGILQIHTRELRLSGDVQLDQVASITAGMSGADLANLCNEAALMAARESHPRVSMADFEAALDKITLGEARHLVMTEADRLVIAYHEAGHAITAWFTPAADEVHKVTVIPHGLALGVTEQIPTEDRYNYRRQELMARLSVMLAGRAAEQLALGEITTGAENDLAQASQLARRMVARWAMSDLGLMTVDSDEQQPFLGYEIAQGRRSSEATAARVDETVQALLEDRFAAAETCLTQHRRQLERLVSALMDHESVGPEELTRLLGPRLHTGPSIEPALGDLGGQHIERGDGQQHQHPLGRQRGEPELVGERQVGDRDGHDRHGRAGPG